MTTAKLDIRDNVRIIGSITVRLTHDVPEYQIDSLLGAMAQAYDRWKDNIY